jgi:hypothetical protein
MRSETCYSGSMARKRTPCGDPVGAVEIAARLGVEDRTVHMWRYRTKTGEMAVPLPPPDYVEVNGSPAWEWETILRWAGETGRLRHDHLQQAYRTIVGQDPHPEWIGGRLGADDPIKQAAERRRKEAERLAKRAAG